MLRPELSRFKSLPPGKIGELQGHLLGTTKAKGGREAQVCDPNEPKQKASLRARTIGARRHRQAQRDTRVKKKARRCRDEARRVEEQARSRARQRKRRRQEPMRVGCTIIRLHFLLGMLRLGVEHAPLLHFIPSHVFSFWAPGEGQL